MNFKNKLNIFINNVYINLKIIKLNSSFNIFKLNERYLIEIPYLVEKNTKINLELNFKTCTFIETDGDENFSVCSFIINNKKVDIGFNSCYPYINLKCTDKKIMINCLKDIEKLKIGIGVVNSNFNNTSESLWFGADPEYFI